MDERLKKQLEFVLEIDKEKQILRQTHIRGYSRQEDDAVLVSIIGKLVKAL